MSAVAGEEGIEVDGGEEASEEATLLDGLDMVSVVVVVVAVLVFELGIL